jgi:hypothetical protein
MFVVPLACRIWYIRDVSVLRHTARPGSSLPLRVKSKPCQAIVFILVSLISSSLLAEGQVPPSEPSTQLYLNSKLGFQFAYPKNWMVAETNFEVSHYLDDFLTINSQRRNLHIWFPMEVQDFDPKFVFQKMLPGEVYLAVGRAEGPGYYPSMGPDSVEKDLLPLLATNPIVSSGQEGLSRFGLAFYKRGRNWTIHGYLRDPIQQEDQRKVIRLLESFRFMEAPVANVSRAESLAWKELPDEMRQLGSWPIGTGSQGGRTVVVDRVDSGYSVQFGLNGVKSWKFMVLESGKVIKQTDGSGE